MLDTTKNVRYTATLPAFYIDELKELANLKQIPSVNFGIRQAIDGYLKQMKKAEYDAKMKEAAKDAAFLKRTFQCADDFSDSDSEVLGEW